ncbi:hypothetical protein [Crossiella cryophila]|uniref:Uncharacterized protein n=1 Tax=Crossiella cryophila TaxID=43355 RepID=A0A7W7C8C1_9PSEU|nr:hypothetical protein [Crossiella cryophila]MBB4675079.1 hypothetical protein [Crossiella cryophila]
MNVDDELRRLFSDDRLELRPLPDAEHAVLTGVKRRQRRRRVAIAATGALSALAIVAGTVAVLQPEMRNTVQPADSSTLTFPSTTGPTEQSSTSAESQGGTASTSNRGGVGSGQGTPPSSSSKPPTSTTTPKTFGTAQIGPTGYGALRLGMTKEQAEATGLIKPNAKAESDSGCLGYDYAGKAKPAGFYTVVISKTKGVVRIHGRGDERTPEGIGVGAPVSDFDKVYTDSGTTHGAVGERVVAAPGNAAANYWFIMRNNAVSEIRLELKEQDCYK